MYGSAAEHHGEMRFHKRPLRQDVPDHKHNEDVPLIHHESKSYHSDKQPLPAFFESH